ncbi:MAG: hypothetical protein RBS73_15665 [Prolixibacteraceae bacterium]|jgi:hypothetical protein|nr:hypothetical protein [Prolixibacteraceae bacterium]
MIHNRIEKSIRQKKKMNYVFVYGIGFLELILLFALVFVAFELVSLSRNNGNISQLYNLIAMGLMLLWIGLLVAYYAWAIYFYNINLGLTNQDWAEIRERKQYIPEGAIEVPSENPHAAQTLGLPPGTLRGTIALTLLVGGIAMAIASLGMDPAVKVDSLVVDNFDFFKTAFLMMIAFYFGNKALEIIGYKSTKALTPGSPSPAAPSGETPSSPVSPVTQAAGESKLLLRQEQQPAAPILPVDGDNDFDNPKAVQ